MSPTKKPRVLKKNNPHAISPDFKERADSAAFYEAWVGAVLARAGLYTLHHPFTIAITGPEIAEYAHTWDLTVGRDDFSDMSDYSTGCPQIPVEVKSVNLTFMNTDTYPFDELMVCSLKSWDNKWPKSSTTKRDFLFVSRQTGCVLWLPTGSAVYIADAFDSVRNQSYKVVKTASGNLKPLSDFVHMVKK